MKPVVGAVFPISVEHATRIFDEGRTVFAKFTNMVNLSRDSRIIFYLSKEKKLIGEGIVKRIEKVNPEIAWSRYCKQLFLNEDEYNQYISWSPIEKKNRKISEITVFVLKNLKKYERPSQLTHSIGPTGYYMTNEEYDKIRV